jgi:hypothetical protein
MYVYCTLCVYKTSMYNVYNTSFADVRATWFFSLRSLKSDSVGGKGKRRVALHVHGLEDWLNCSVAAEAVLIGQPRSAPRNEVAMF